MACTFAMTMFLYTKPEWVFSGSHGILGTGVGVHHFSRTWVAGSLPIRSQRIHGTGIQRGVVRWGGFGAVNMPVPLVVFGDP